MVEPRGDRTPDLLNAIQALYQLSYDPIRRARNLKSQPRLSNFLPSRSERNSRRPHVDTAIRSIACRENPRRRTPMRTSSGAETSKSVPSEIYPKYTAMMACHPYRNYGKRSSVAELWRTHPALETSGSRFRA